MGLSIMGFISLTYYGLLTYDGIGMLDRVILVALVHVQNDI